MQEAVKSHIYLCSDTFFFCFIHEQLGHCHNFFDRAFHRQCKEVSMKTIRPHINDRAPDELFTVVALHEGKYQL